MFQVLAFGVVSRMQVWILGYKFKICLFVLDLRVFGLDFMIQGLQCLKLKGYAFEIRQKKQR